MLRGLYIDSWVYGVRDGKIPSDAVNLVNNKDFDLREVDGLGRPDAEMYTQDKVSVDASFYSGQTIKSRTITLTVKTRNDFCRMRLYHMLGYGDKRCIFVETDAGTFWIEGYVKGASYTAKPAERQEIEISIFCPYPWFRSLKRKKVPIALNDQYNDVEIVSDSGDVEAGIQLWYPAGHSDDITSISVSSGGSGIRYSAEMRVENSKRDTLLLDTTPGDYYICEDEYGATIENVEVTGELPTISRYMRVRVAGASTTGYIAWYDTWSGI